MAEPRKVQFVTLSGLTGGPGAEDKRRRLEEDGDAEMSFDREGRMTTTTGTGVTATGDRGGSMGKRDGDEPRGKTVRLDLCLSEPDEQRSAEFNYSELVQSQQAKKVPRGSTSILDPNDPFNDDERERQRVEALAKKFESKYGNAGKKRRKDRMQDLIDIGFGYDESDPFIDNTEAYDELVPASLSTKLGGFYINTGTLQFRAASESEGEDGGKDQKSRMRAGEEPLIKRRKKKDGISIEEKKPRKNKVSKQGVTGLNLHRPEKKKRKKLMKDSLCLAAMLRRFTREKEELRRRDANTPHVGPSLTSMPNSHNLLQNSHLQGNNNDLSLADLTADPAMMSLLSSANEREIQDIIQDLDFSFLDAGLQMTPSGRENGQVETGSSSRHKIGGGVLSRGLISLPPLPEGLPAPLIKRIEDLRAASRQFDQEGRKKFFTLDMNNILLDIELQVQEQPADVRSQVYSHLEAFVPCNKEALLKRLKKLSLNIQDDRLRTPLLNLKLAVCSVMPEQIARYNMDCMAKVAAKQQMEESEKNGSEDDDDEKPGKRVMGPRKKFIWDDKLRTLLCNLVRVKLSCYELEQCSQSVEDYLKAFMENEVKPLWPKGWMQARMLFKESRAVHGHLTGLGKKRIVPTPKVAKMTEFNWTQRPAPGVGTASTSPALPACRPPSSPSEPICLSDSLDEDLAANSLDSISQALALLSNAAKGLTPNNGVPASSPGIARSLSVVSHYSSPLSHSSPAAKMEPSGVSNKNSLTTSPSLCSPVTSSPLSSMRGETFAMLKDTGSVQRHPVTVAHRIINAAQAAKPRPPPTASPLLPPQQRSFGAIVKPGLTPPPVGHAKNCANKSGGIVVGGITGTGVSKQPRMSPHPLQLKSKSPQQSRVSSSPTTNCSSPSTLLSQAKTVSMPHNQSNFITPMQATLTKSSHSSSSPIIKLTPRPPAPTPPPSSSPCPSSSPSLIHTRPQMITSPHQFTPKSQLFRPTFTTQGPGVKSGSGQACYSFAGGQKSTSPQGGAASNTISTLMVSPLSVKHDSSPSPSAVPANHSQRQRPMVGASQSAKSSTSRASAMTLQSPSVSSHHSQGQTASGNNLLGSVTPPLPLGFGMLGGLVPVSLPFQFPSILNFNPPGPGVPGCSNMGASPAQNSGYTLAQNTNQSQGGDTKRKSH